MWMGRIRKRKKNLRVEFFLLSCGAYAETTKAGTEPPGARVLSSKPNPFFRAMFMLVLHTHRSLILVWVP